MPPGSAVLTGKSESQQTGAGGGKWPLSVRLQDLPIAPLHACPYLPGRKAQEAVFAARRLDPEVCHDLMDAGFRRSGLLFYRPICPGCRECVPVRVPTATFRPSRSQRRVWRRNEDLTARVQRPRLTRAKSELYTRYLAYQHDGSMDGSAEELRSFLYSSPVQTIEIEYWLGEELAAVSLADLCSRSLSSVYSYFEPVLARRSLGVYSGLWEIAHCQRAGIPYYYLGFYVAGSRKMNYKDRYQPCERLLAQGRWEPMAPTSATGS
jgi:arginyl-tRNA--protein-N-Asp/Glu arginylyltransferase